MAEASPVSLNIDSKFQEFSKCGGGKSDGKSITLQQTDKWLRMAGIIDGKAITSKECSEAFNKLKMKSLKMEDFLKFVDELARSKNIEPKDFLQKLSSCGSADEAPASACNKFK